MDYLTIMLALTLSTAPPPVDPSDKSSRYAAGFHGGLYSDAPRYTIPLSTQPGERSWIDVRLKNVRGRPGVGITFRF